MNATETIPSVDPRPTAITTAPNRVIPLSMRKADIAILGFYWLNLLFITYIVDVEQLVIPDMHGAWTYPIWPPKPMVDLIHWYGNNFDPVLIARPVWWKMTIWIDSILFGPYYAFAIYAFTKGKNWIRLPSIIQSSFLITVVLVILGEETWGEHATPNRLFVYLDNAPWLLFPIFVIYRMYRSETPFTSAASASSSPSKSA
jgi:hypothetical protein